MSLVWRSLPFYACGFALGIKVACYKDLSWANGMECFDQQDLPNQLWNKNLMLHNVLQRTVSMKSDVDLRIFVVQSVLKKKKNFLVKFP